MLDLKTFCKKIEPYVTYYKRLMTSCNNTTHNILEKEINLLPPQMPRVQKHGIMRVYLAFYRIKETKPYIKQLLPWIARQIFSAIS